MFYLELAHTDCRFKIVEFVEREIALAAFHRLTGQSNVRQATLYHDAAVIRSFNAGRA